MHILLSNDDGYQAQGLITLYAALSEIATVTVVVPKANQSGVSNALSLRKSFAVSQGERGFIIVDGTPADCVHIALNGMLKSVPDMVIAGINHGANLGEDVIYSGTVAAAIEGRSLALPALAISLASGQPCYFDTAAKVTVELVLRLKGASLPDNTVLNVNVPDRPFDQLTGLEATRLGARHKVQPSIEVCSDDGERRFRLGALGEAAALNRGTDFDAIRHDRVSVTPLQVDLTQYRSLDSVMQWLGPIEWNGK